MEGQLSYVVLAHPLEAGFGVDLGRADPPVPMELLHLIQRHARIQQDGTILI